MDARNMTLSALAETLGQGLSEMCHARVYSCLRHNVEDVVTSLAGFGEGEEAIGAVALVSIDLSDVKFWHSKSILFEQDQKLVVWLDIKDLTLPKVNFLMIAAPHPPDGSHVPAARVMIDRVRALLSIRYGTLAFFDEVTSFDFDRKGQLHHASDWVRRPMGADMLFFPKPLPAPLVRQMMSEPHAEQARTSRAVSFLARAFDEKSEMFRFTSYWVALEVISGGSAGTIRSKLAKAYGIRSINTIDRVLSFSDISGLRHGLLHKGTFGSFRPYQERLMIAYFWDIFFLENGYETQRYAETILASPSVQDEMRRMDVNETGAAANN